MITHDLIPALDRLGHPRVLVLGDLILDRYTFGNAERVSQEAPVILLRAEQREARLGGAANVCHLLRGLEAEVACAGVVGADADGGVLKSMLASAGAEVAGVFDDSARPTTVKERFIGRAQGRHPHQMLRVDSEVRDPLAAELAQRLGDWVEAELGRFDVVLISDYDKGVCTPGLLRRTIDAARQRGMPVLVDPIRSTNYARYRGATTMTPNRLEAGLATGTTLDTVERAYAAGQRLCLQLDLDYAIVTLDRDGMALAYPNGESRLFSTRPRAVYDITGAGDMALATIGVCIAGGLPVQDALRLANVAAGLEVEKVGVAVVPRAEIRERLHEEALAHPPAPATAPGAKVVSRDEMARLAAERRQAGERIVFTNGCFDLLHVGHATYLAEARSQGDALVVGLNADTSVARLKGPTRPIIGERDRAAMLAALASVDYVVIFDEETPLETIRAVRPDVLVKGGGYQATEIVGRDVVESYGGRVCVTEMVEGVSTTQILSRLTAAPPPPRPHFDRAPSSRQEAA